MILGTIGFETRMDSTVIGDSVNLASRLEGLTKKYAIPIAISSFTVKALTRPEKFMVREIDIVQVKGKQQAVMVYEVFDNNEPAIRDVKLKTLKQYDEGISRFRQGEWREAHRLFGELKKKLPTDRVVEISEQRSRHFVENPPASPEMVITRFDDK